MSSGAEEAGGEVDTQAAANRPVNVNVTACNFYKYKDFSRDEPKLNFCPVLKKPVRTKSKVVPHRGKSKACSGAARRLVQPEPGLVLVLSTGAAWREPGAGAELRLLLRPSQVEQVRISFQLVFNITSTFIKVFLL